MSTDLEQALRRALDATGDIIQQPHHDLARHAVRLHHRRRMAHRGAAGAAFLAVGAVAAGVYGAVGPRRS